MTFKPAECLRFFDAHSSSVFFHDHCVPTERTVNFEPLLSGSGPTELIMWNRAGSPARRIVALWEPNGVEGLNRESRSREAAGRRN
jgi:hypothetical protein